MKLIADNFASRFGHWGFTLPEKDIKDRCGGYIQDSGWLIQYCFGKDELVSIWITTQLIE